MITITVTIAAGGQGQVHKAVSVCKGFDFGSSPITRPTTAGLVRKYAVEAAEDAAVAAIDQELGA